MLILAGFSTISIGYKGTVTMGSGGLASISNKLLASRILAKTANNGVQQWTEAHNKLHWTFV
jgi:hypothetical protein